MVTDLRRIAERTVCRRSERASLRGRLLHVLGCAEGRLGNNIMPRLSVAVNLGVKRIDEELGLELYALADLLERARWKRIPVSLRVRSIVVISDAMWEPPSTARLHYIVIPEDGEPFGRWIDIPSTFWGSCLPRETQIMMAELIAPLIALLAHPGIFAGKAVTIYNDNLVAVSALINGASRAADLNIIGCAFATFAHRRNCPYWVLGRVGSQRL